MGKLMVFLAVLGFLFFSADNTRAELFAKEKPASKPAAVQTTQQTDAQGDVMKRKAEMTGTEWSIEVKPMTGKAKAEKDTLTFFNNKVVSKNLEAKGYVSTNFSMRLLEDNETYAWETMQTSEKDGGTAFWRGDIGPDGVMRGVLSIRDKKGKVTDYNFHSVESRKAAIIEPVPAE